MSNSKSTLGYILMLLSLLIVVYYNFQRAEVHMISAWDAIGNFIVQAMIYGVATVVGLAGLLLIKASGISRKRLVIVVYLGGIAGSFYYLHEKTKESTVPVYISASGAHVSLVLRIDSTYRITNYGYHMGESWQDGKYSLSGNRITLISKGPLEAGLGSELWIKGDTVFYGDSNIESVLVREGSYLTIVR